MRFHSTKRDFASIESFFAKDLIGGEKRRGASLSLHPLRLVLVALTKKTQENHKQDSDIQIDLHGSKNIVLFRQCMFPISHDQLRVVGQILQKIWGMK